jgi:hypothetical protein
MHSMGFEIFVAFEMYRTHKQQTKRRHDSLSVRGKEFKEGQETKASTVCEKCK